MRFDRLDQVWLELDQLQEERLQLIAILAGQHLSHRLARLDLLRVFVRCQEHRDDVFAPAAPVVRAGAGSAAEPVASEGDLDAIRLGVAAPDSGFQYRRALNQRHNRAALTVLTTTLERLGRGVLPDIGLGVLGQAHGDAHRWT